MFSSSFTLPGSSRNHTVRLKKRRLRNHGLGNEMAAGKDGKAILLGERVTKKPLRIPGSSLTMPTYLFSFLF